MNEQQKRFFEELAKIQESCVQVCRIEHRNFDPKVEKMLYDVTYQTITEIMELMDGCSGFGSEPLDLVNAVTGERLKENPKIQLHDQTEGLLRQG